VVPAAKEQHCTTPVFRTDIYFRILSLIDGLVARSDYAALYKANAGEE